MTKVKRVIAINSENKPLKKKVKVYVRKTKYHFPTYSEDELYEEALEPMNYIKYKKPSCILGSNNDPIGENAYKKQIKYQNMFDAIIYTDGGYTNVKNIGTWAYIIQLIDHDEPNKKINWVMACNSGPIFSDDDEVDYSVEEKVFVMETIAILKALKMLKDNNMRFNIKNINIFSDSKMACNHNELIEEYEINDWYNLYTRKFVSEKFKKFLLKLKETVLNFNNITFTHIKAHAGDTWNEYCDKVCTIRKFNSDPEQMSSEFIYYFNIL